MSHDKTCATCKWHDDFTAVCCNGLSPDRADFTDPEHSCGAWEQADAQTGQKGKGDG